MLMSASRALADCSPLATKGEGPVLPQLKDIQQVSRYIAIEVAKAAQAAGVAIETSEEVLTQAVEDNFWKPQYRHYRRTSI